MFKERECRRERDLRSDCREGMQHPFTTGKRERRPNKGRVWRQSCFQRAVGVENGNLDLNSATINGRICRLRPGNANSASASFIEDGSGRINCKEMRVQDGLLMVTLVTLSTLRGGKSTKSARILSFPCSKNSSKSRSALVLGHWTLEREWKEAGVFHSRLRCALLPLRRARMTLADGTTTSRNN